MNPDEPRVIKGQFVNYRPVKGRAVLQLFIDVQETDAIEVLSKLGTPTTGESLWVAVARLDIPKSPGGD